MRDSRWEIELQKKCMMLVHHLAGKISEGIPF